MNNKQWQIGGVKIDGQAILAPMAGVSDIAYRLLAKEYGASLVCTEMVSAMGIKYKNERTHELLRLKRQNDLFLCKSSVPIQRLLPSEQRL